MARLYQQAASVGSAWGRARGSGKLFGRLRQFLAARDPALDSAELNLVFVTVIPEYGRRTGGPTTAPSIGHDGLVFRDFRQAALQLIDRDVGVTRDHPVLHQFFRRADVE